MLMINNQAHLTEDETIILGALLSNFVNITNEQLMKNIPLDHTHKHMYDHSVEMLNKIEGKINV